MLTLSFMARTIRSTGYGSNILVGFNTLASSCVNGKIWKCYSFARQNQLFGDFA